MLRPYDSRDPMPRWGGQSNPCPLAGCSAIALRIPLGDPQQGHGWLDSLTWYTLCPLPPAFAAWREPFCPSWGEPPATGGSHTPPDPGGGAPATGVRPGWTEGGGQRN